MLEIRIDTRGVKALYPKGWNRAAKRALRKAGTTATRDMKSEASKRVRQRKRIKAAVVRKALHIRRPRNPSLDGGEWGIDVSGGTVRVSDYSGYRQTRRGVTVGINKGKRSLIKGAFVVTLASGHRGVFVRRGARRLPIVEKLASRPVDALLHEGEAEAVAVRGSESFARTFKRVLPLELDKEKG